MFLELWENCTAEDVFDQFTASEEERKGVKILLAWYNYECYDGNAFVLFEKDGKLYEVVGGHCSCYGLEGQWEPVETTAKALRMRCETVEYGSYLEEVLDERL